MPWFRNHSVSATWLMLAVIVLCGGLIKAHSHDGPASGALGSVSLSAGPNLPDTAEHVDSLTCIEDDLCPACTAGQREALLDASPPNSRLLMKAARSLHVATCPATFAGNARPPAPRGPPTV